MGKRLRRGGVGLLGVVAVSPRDLLVRYVAVVVVAVFGIGILATGDEVQVEWLRFFAFATLVASLGLLSWEHVLWRLPLTQRIPQVPRNIRGTWRGQLVSHWVNPETGNRIEPKTLYLVIRQTASTLIVTLITDESKSKSSSAALDRSDGQWALAYMYLNKPNMAVEHRSRMHHGSTLLELSGSPVARLTGRYWTDRDSKGELELTDRNAQIVDDYDSARRLFDDARERPSM